MKLISDIINQSYHNFLFLGEAGSGKSETAVNFAKYLNESDDKMVHFFDMDMTKPLFRSRDIREKLNRLGIEFHHEEQFMDAPTLVGGVSRLLRDSGCYVVIDAGGDYIGARAVGGLAPLINRPETAAYYVINPYRPWSDHLDHVNQVLGAVLGVSHIRIEKLRLIANPNIGPDTSMAEVRAGFEHLEVMVNAHKPLDFICVREELSQRLEKKMNIPVLPLHLYLKYPWVKDGEVDI